jgi:hypothetical protein
MGPYSPVPSHLPVKGNLVYSSVLSLVVAVLMTGLSLGGLLYSSTFYPTDKLVQSFLPNDLISLLIGLPILLGSMWLTWRGNLVGLLLWPGALLYVFYNYIVYVLGMPPSLLSLAYTAIVLLGACGILDLLRKIDGRPIKERLSGGVGVPARAAGGVLLVFGAVFALRAVLIVLQAGTDQTMLPASEIGLLIADFLLSVIMVGGGVLLLLGRPLGYVGGLGLLFASSMLFVGLIIVLLLQPILTDAPFVLLDVIVVLLMGLICFVPFALFLRGATLTGEHEHDHLSR